MMIALALMACARALPAQRVNGQIRDAETDAALSGATLTLLDEQGRGVHAATSDGRGVFTLRAPGPGLYRIQASRLGYREAVSAPIELASPTAVALELRLSSDAIRLDPLTVTALPRYERLDEHGFYERRDRFGPDGLNQAIFLEQHDIERLNAFRVGDIFRGMRGVYTERGGLRMRRGCTPAIVVDGFLSRAGNSRLARQSINPLPPIARREVASPRSLVGVEVYYGAAIPERYLIDAGGCGVILFWTK